MLVARKISEDAWLDMPLHDSDSISDITTKKHELSVWKVNDDLSNLNEVALAIALSRDYVSGIYLVLLNPEEIRERFSWDLDIKQSDGDTLYTTMRKDHVNLMITTLTEMGYIAEYIHKSIDSPKIKYIDEIILKEILYNEAQAGHIENLKSKGRWKRAMDDYIKENDLQPIRYS